MRKLESVEKDGFSLPPQEATMPSGVRTTRRIVLSGSMGVYGSILDVATLLASLQIPAVVPESEDDSLRQMPCDAFEEFKRRVSFAYLKKIRDPRTFAVLAVNLDRHRIPNYMGPNTFAEIAVAFAQSKRIYLYQGMPEAYIDELSAWRAVLLNGSLEQIAADFWKSCMKEDKQLKLPL
jgi:hypothetical protein